MPTKWIFNRETGKPLPVYYETRTPSEMTRGIKPMHAWGCTYCGTGGLEETADIAGTFARHHAAQSHNYPRRCSGVRNDGLPCGNAAKGNGEYCGNHYPTQPQRKGRRA